MEGFEHKGLFWLPGDTENQFAGVLKFDPIEGASFETIGFSFLHYEINKRAKPMPQNAVWDITSGLPSGTEFICGYTEKGREVTLFNCLYDGETMAIGYVCTDPIKLDTESLIVISKQPFWTAGDPTAAQIQQV